MPRLTPYAGYEKRARHTSFARRAVLDLNGEDNALRLFRLGRDTVDIADILWCTEAAAHSALSRARDRHR